MFASGRLSMVGFAAALLAGTSVAQDTKNQGYLVDSYGNNITTSSNTGLCWRSSDWTPERAAEPCDPAPKKAQAPAPKVLATAPPSVKPPVESAPVRVVPQSISFSADMLFAFDKSVLKPEGKQALDEFVRQLSAAQYEAIVVTGHTDRLGSSEYNQRLSQRRANAVKEYLASKDVPSARINAIGKGETQPVTRAGECKGAARTKVIACLQPDRRVHVEVNGTKMPAISSR